MAQTETLSQIRALVADLHPVPDADSAALDMDSLSIVMLIEALEDKLGMHVAARDVVPENFATIAALADYVERNRPLSPREPTPS